VVSPLISLMKDQVERLVGKSVSATFLNSTLTDEQSHERLAAISSGSLKLLYVAPERLESEELLRRLREARVAMLAVDEAHCISEWGHEFRPSFRRIATANRGMGRPQVVALTATATPAVRVDIVQQLAMCSPRIIVAGFDRPNLEYSVRVCRSDAEKQIALLETLRRQTSPSIVYASTRSVVERVHRLLRLRGLRSDAYHGGLHETDRNRAQDAFMSGGIDVIVATNAFGMGIDKANVRLVVHYSMPGTLEAYYQEAGRAGRDGQASHCLLLHAPHDHLTHEWFVRGMYPDRDLVAREFDAIVRSQVDGVVARRPTGRAQTAAYRLLTREGVLAARGKSAKTSVRLLATPNRIRRELSSAELELLRDLWRSAGASIQSGAVLDLGRIKSRLPLRGRLLMLQTLKARQFIDFATHADDVSLAPSARAFDSLPIDWQTLDRRMANDLAKLDAMKSYVHTTNCRREFVLRYFGDRAARPDCGACDNCLVS
jgi:ATP-dependent DNA helicase RecQ